MFNLRIKYNWERMCDGENNHQYVIIPDKLLQNFFKNE